MSKKINKEMTFNEILEKFPEAEEILLEFGLSCIGCPFAKMETLEQGAKVHNIDVDKIVEKLNKLKDKNNGKK